LTKTSNNAEYNVPKNSPSIKHSCLSTRCPLKSKIRKASPVPKDICQMLGLANDILLPRTEITKKIYDYIKTNNLQDESDKRIIKPNNELKKIFNLSDGEEVSFLNIQTYIKKAYSSGTGQEDVENQENIATV
jgi:chromatin remodeling complex protein RSC6